MKDKKIPEIKNRKLGNVNLKDMRVSERGQRELRPAWVHELAAHMDFEKLGTPLVSLREGVYYIMDGQHRIEALKKFWGDGWEEVPIPCWIYTGLSEKQEADHFAGMNYRKAVSAWDMFKVRVEAGYADESSVLKVVESLGLHISKRKAEGGVQAVTVLLRIFTHYGTEELRSALEIARDAFGDSGLEGPVLMGLGMLCNRYNGTLNVSVAKQALGNMRGGVGGLMGRANQLKLKTHNSLASCVAGAAVDVINKNRGSMKKLADWWKPE